MDEEEMLQRITRLLEQGGTMLATHHGCGAPLFRWKGEIVCPVCSFAEGQSAVSPGKDQVGPSVSSKTGDAGEWSKEEKSTREKVAEERSVEEKGVEEKDVEKTGSEATSRPPDISPGEEDAWLHAAQASRTEPTIDDLKRSVLRKLRDLTEAMEREQDLDRLRRQLDCIEGALKVLRSMER